jgi:protein-disulfide isomerase
MLRIGSPSKILETVASLSMCIASATMVWAVWSQRSATLDGSLGAAAINAQTIDFTLSAASFEHDATRGNRSAKIAILEFSDYQCPFCGRNARDVFPEVQREYVNTGKVKYVFLNFPLNDAHPQAVKAAEAADCAGKLGKYWEMHDALFANQQALFEPDLVTYAERIGLRRSDFRKCIESQSASNINDDVKVGHMLDINATPMFFVGTVQPDGGVRLRRKLQGALPYLTFKAVIEEMLRSS